MRGRACTNGPIALQHAQPWSSELALEIPFTLTDLAAIVSERANASAEASYTRKLLDRGVEHCAKKLGEEAVETALASVTEDRERVIGEAADLLYHFLVLLQARGIELTEVEAVLAKRTGASGLRKRRLACRSPPSGSVRPWPWNSAPTLKSRPIACSPRAIGRRCALIRR